MLARISACVALLSLLMFAQTPSQPTINLNPVAGPPDPAKLHPVERVTRFRFGVVHPFPLDKNDLNALVYPSATGAERNAVLEGLKFFTTPHTAAQGLGPIANQKFCLGCHLSSSNALAVDAHGNKLVTTVSPVSRAARSTPTNFFFTSFDPETGGGRAADHLDAVNDTGLTAAFTIFGDFHPMTNMFNGLTQFSSNSVQHTRPSKPECLPDSIPPISQDPNLAGMLDPVTMLSSLGFRRTTGERAGPPYIGRGLMETVWDGDILANEVTEQGAANSSLDVPGDFPECQGECLQGRHNENTSNQAFVGGHTDKRVGRFGLRAAGPTIVQFVVGGMQGELSFTSVLNTHELMDSVNKNRPGCVDTAPQPNSPFTTPVSLRALLRLTAPPEFGQALLSVLKAPNPNAPWPGETKEEARVQRGAQLFGIDLVAFANRMIPGRMPQGGDGLDKHAINQTDRKVGCAGCHTPVMATGQSQAETGAELLSNVWVPLFSDLLIHSMSNIDAERFAQTVREPLVIQRADANGHLRETFDIARGGADDTLPNQGLANGREWRTPPLMGLGRMGPPFTHDARVYLSKLSFGQHPAGTVYTDRDETNAPLVVRTLDDAIRAAIEFHDLPAPFNASNQSTKVGGGCPVPPGNKIGGVTYQNGAADICPPYNSQTSINNRSGARKVIKRWHGLSKEDQEAIIQFLKQL